MTSDLSCNASVILLTYNRCDALEAVLYGLSIQKTKPMEVIITDDGSNSVQVEAVLNTLRTRKWPFKLKYVWQPDIGFTASTARNNGVRHSSGDYLVFLDGDCVPRHDFIHEHLRLRKSGCFINGSRVLLNQEMTAEIIRQPELIDKSSLFWLKQRLHGRINKWLPTIGRIPPCLRASSSSFQWKGIRSCNFSLWKADFVKINGFDESFVGWGHEDADFVWRLQRAGFRRINGYWSTEVFHLWHREASRDRESTNARRLKARMADPNAPYRAELGLLEELTASPEILFSN